MYGTFPHVKPRPFPRMGWCFYSNLWGLLQSCKLLIRTRIPSRNLLDIKLNDIFWTNLYRGHIKEIPEWPSCAIQITRIFSSLTLSDRVYIYKCRPPPPLPNISQCRLGGKTKGGRKTKENVKKGRKDDR
jgi:hypothetical protein